MTDTRCPCCQQELPKQKRLEFYYPDVIYDGKVARLHAMEFKILQAGWRSRLSTMELADAIYADRADGGPNTVNDVLAVTVFRMNKKLAPLGLVYRSTRGRSCYYELKNVA
jgi:hypothetical protein